MNPELQRNIWLEMTPRRMAMMLGILVLAFFAAATPSSILPNSTLQGARILFYGIVVLWGTRNAALSVVGEIRDRTWDFQRLSSLSAADMTWGKLFGSTVYNWFGGAICLIVMIGSLFLTQGPVAAFIELVYAVCIGVVAQGAAFLASLIAIRRRQQSHSRRDVILYQAIGILAACIVYYYWQLADPARLLSGEGSGLQNIEWWGHAYEGRSFILVSLALLLGWILTGCYRAMRIELKLRNGPLVWIGFLVFVGIYVAGFEPESTAAELRMDDISVRLALAGFAYMALTYLMVLIEPKERVHLRWLGRQMTRGNLPALFDGLQAWMVSYVATLVMAITLLLRLDGEMASTTLIVAALGFLTRDIGIFILMQTRAGKHSGDFAALAFLFALYILLPSILEGLGLPDLLYMLYPGSEAVPMLAIAAPWIEALLVLSFALRRLALPESQPALK